MSPPTKLTLTKGQGHYPPFPGLFVCLIKGPAPCRLCLLSHPEVRSSIGYGDQCVIKQWFSCFRWIGGLQGVAPQILLRSVTSFAGVVIKCSQGQAQKQRDTLPATWSNFNGRAPSPVFPGGSQPQVKNRFSVFSEGSLCFGSGPTERNTKQQASEAKQAKKRKARTGKENDSTDSGSESRRFLTSTATCRAGARDLARSGVTSTGRPPRRQQQKPGEPRLRLISRIST